MAGSLNKVTLIGHLGKDPEIRITQDGAKVATLSVATSEQWKDRATEERKERVEWHKVVVFNVRLSDIVERIFKKGQKVYIEGQLQTRKWTDAQNQEHRVQEIVIRYKGDVMILDNKGDSLDYRQGDSSSEVSVSSEIDDEIPF
jgi:single-strand DNA-binding protein